VSASTNAVTTRAELRERERSRLTTALIDCEATLHVRSRGLSVLHRTLVAEAVSERAEQLRRELAALDRAAREEWRVAQRKRAQRGRDAGAA
jgi:hypothetical protein